MATQAEKIEELTRTVAMLVERVDAIQAELRRDTQRHEGELQRQMDRHDTLARAVEETRTSAAVLRRDVDELHKARDEWGRRLWALLSPLVGVLVGVLLTYLFRHLP